MLLSAVIASYPVCQQAAMKAVVATSRMHEGSRRRTDSCEIPGSGTSRQSSMQQDPPTESSSPAATEKESPPLDVQLQQKDESKSTKRNPPNCSPPSSSETPNSDVTPTVPSPNRPPLRADGLRQLSIIPKTVPVQPQLPQKSCSVVEPTCRVDTAPALATPPSPDRLSNGFISEAQPASKTTHHEWSLFRFPWT